MALPPFTSKLIANVGVSMGDEGKGRLVYELINEIGKGKDGRASVILKVNGGANSGHTAAGLKLNLLPSGITEKGVEHLALGSGVVADPRKIWWEVKPLEAFGYEVVPRLKIDERTQVSDLTHRLLDLACEFYRENILSEEPRGSTGRGISPAFADEANQTQIFFSIFREEKAIFANKLKQRIERTLKMIQHVYEVPESVWHGFFETLTKSESQANDASVQGGIFKKEEFDFNLFKGDRPFSLNADYLIDIYWKAGSELKDQIVDVREIILEEQAKGNYVIGEFGQSYWLDKRFGFRPNVTASHTYTPEFFQSAGIPLQRIHTVACAKAYDTKVGTHEFITEMPEGHPLTKHLKSLEYGTSTGRQRMVGWFDAVEKGDALRYGGFQDLVINKLDVLTYQKEWEGAELLICVAYIDEQGNKIYSVPREKVIRKKLRPVYIQLPGWKESISEIRSFEKLPQNAKVYIATLVQSVIDVATHRGAISALPNLRYIGVGPNPEQIIQDIPSTKELLKLSSNSK